MSTDRVESDGAWSTDETERLYGAHRLSLVRLAVLLLDDVPAADAVVQDAFATFLGHRRALSDPDEALAFLRARVLEGTRGRRPADLPAQSLSFDRPAGGDDDRAPTQAELRRVLLADVAALPDRQREVLVLRLWSQLPEMQICDVLDASAGAVRTADARALQSLAAGRAGSGIESEVAVALSSRAEEVTPDEVSVGGLPEPRASRARSGRVVALVAAALVTVGTVLAIPFVTDPAADDAGENGVFELPEGAVKIDFNGDGGSDIASVDFDPTARTWMLSIDLFAAGPVLTYQGLAANRPTLIGAADLDGDYHDEVAVHVGDDAGDLPEFFRYAHQSIRRLTPPPTTQDVNGYVMSSPLNQFSLLHGRLYSWHDDPSSVADPQITPFWQWRVVGEDRIAPGEREERCLPVGADFPKTCSFLPRDLTQETRADLDGDGTADLVTLSYTAREAEGMVEEFTVSVELATGGFRSAQGPGGWGPRLLEPGPAGRQGRQQVVVSQEGGDSDIRTTFRLVRDRLVADDG